MPRKPWTPYAKSLEAACNVLAEGLAPAPFGTMTKAGAWIGARTFIEIISTDFEARALIDKLLQGTPERFRQVLGGDGIRWELMLRCQCANAICMGRVENRREFDWTKPPEEVYRLLLIEYWRTTALRWAKKEFGMAGYAEAKVAEREVHQMKKRSARIDPSAN